MAATRSAPGCAAPASPAAACARPGPPDMTDHQPQPPPPPQHGGPCHTPRSSTQLMVRVRMEIMIRTD
jgi:hypothetical protein